MALTDYQSLLKKTQFFLTLAELPMLLNVAGHLIKNDFKLSDMELREPKKSEGFQRLHIDGQIKKKSTDPATMAVCFLYLDDSTESNGAISLIPGSHKYLQNPKDRVNVMEADPRERVIEAPKGSLLVIDSSVWHRGRTNISGQRRRVILINYRVRNLQQQVHMKSYFNLEERKRLTTSQRHLLSLNNDDPNFYLKRFTFRYRKTPIIKLAVKLKSSFKQMFKI